MRHTERRNIPYNPDCRARLARLTFIALTTHPRALFCKKNTTLFANSLFTGARGSAAAAGGSACGAWTRWIGAQLFAQLRVVLPIATFLLIFEYTALRKKTAEGLTDLIFGKENEKCVCTLESERGD